MGRIESQNSSIGCKEELLSSGINKERGMRILEGLLDTAARRGVAPKEIDATRKGIEKAYSEWEAGDEMRGLANAAFLIHTRSYDGCHPDLDDTGAFFPPFTMGKLKGESDDEKRQRQSDVEELWKCLPPIRVGEISGTMPNGQEVKCALISVSITVSELYNKKDNVERGLYAAPHISEAVQLANKMGADGGVIGLGETLASLTMHGQLLKGLYPENEFTTGHTFTTLLIGEWIKEAATSKGKDLADANVVVLGGAGSIGTATMGFLADTGVKHLTLYDKDSKRERMQEKAKKVGLEGRVTILTEPDDFDPQTIDEDKNLMEAFKNVDIIVSGIASLKPRVTSEHLRNDHGVGYVDDSQPPSIWREEADKAGARLYWVVGRLPEGMKRNYDFRIKGEFGCAMEAVALTALKLQGESFPYDPVGKVTAEKVEKARELYFGMNCSLPEPESFGKEV